MPRKKNTPGQKMLSGTRPKRQVCRSIRLRCSQCGYTVRTTRKWIAQGLPLCPCTRELQRFSTFVAEGGSQHAL